MEKSLCTLAAVIFLGGFLGAALTDNTTTEINSLFNNTTTAESVTVQLQDHSTARPTPTAAQTKLSTTTTKTTTTVKQLDTKNISQDSKEEETDDSKKEDEETKLGRTKHIFGFTFFVKL